jgi:hypothetical protein
MGSKRMRRHARSSAWDQEILLASTHSHEGPDTIGAWGDGFLKDGKYPKYLQFRRPADCEEHRRRQRPDCGRRDYGFGVTDPRRSPSHRRDADADRRAAAALLRRGVAGHAARLNRVGARTIATLVSWNTHPGVDGGPRTPS